MMGIQGGLTAALVDAAASRARPYSARLGCELVLLLLMVVVVRVMV